MLGHDSSARIAFRIEMDGLSADEFCGSQSRKEAHPVESELVTVHDWKVKTC